MKFSIWEQELCGFALKLQLGAGPMNVKSLISFLIFFDLHQGLGQIMKLLVARAWILWLWVEALPDN